MIKKLIENIVLTIQVCILLILDFDGEKTWEDCIKEIKKRNDKATTD